MFDVSTLKGLNTPQLRRIARSLKTSQPLAEELWNSGVHNARVLATFVGDPRAITPETMDKWAAEIDSWGICDACCCDLFDRTPHAWPKIRQWARDDREFVRRAAFATIAALAVHDKAAPDSVFLKALPLIEKYSSDKRHYVRKGISWALRNIGKRNASLRPAALACAERIGFKDAIRELTGFVPNKRGR